MLNHVWLFCDSMNCSLTGCPWDFPKGCCFLLQGIFQTRNQTRVSCIAGRFFTSSVKMRQGREKKSILQGWGQNKHIRLSQQPSVLLFWNSPSSGLFYAGSWFSDFTFHKWHNLCQLLHRYKCVLHPTNCHLVPLPKGDCVLIRITAEGSR